jgi:hypothetical protein
MNEVTFSFLNKEPGLYSTQRLLWASFTDIEVREQPKLQPKNKNIRYSFLNKTDRKISSAKILYEKKIQISKVQSNKT